MQEDKIIISRDTGKPGGDHTAICIMRAGKTHSSIMEVFCIEHKKAVNNQRTPNFLEKKSGHYF